jgi:flagellar hook assembly protein FlgD
MNRTIFSISVVFFSLLLGTQVNANSGDKPEVVSITEKGNELIFNFTTISHGGTYNPRHCLAVWITNSTDVFKRTIKLSASTYKVHLVKWNQMSGGNTVDAITGASLNQHESHTLYWDGKDKNAVLQPDGNYKLYVEFTESNSASPSIPDGPWTSFTFTKGLTQTQNPANTNYFHNVSLQTIGVTGIEAVLNGGSLQVYPNPVTTEAQIHIKIPNVTDLNVSIVGIDGKIYHQYPNKKYEAGEHIFVWYPKEENAKPGIYLVKIASGNKLVTKKLIVK